MSVAKSRQTSKDRLIANAFLVLMMSPVIFLIWKYQKKPPTSPTGAIATNLTP